MTLLYQDPFFLQHLTGAHPERPARIAAISEKLSDDGLADRCSKPMWGMASLEQVERLHDHFYVEELKKYAAAGGGRIESDTVLSPQSYDVAMLAAGAVCDAVDRVLAGEDASALCLVRPPGHHALHNAPMGFCLFNNVAVGARQAIARGLDRVLVVDWDVHHGNGTQDMFWRDEQVGFFSIHRFPFYPGTGAGDETGEGPGLGYTLNVPMDYALATPESFCQRFSLELERFANRVKPQLVLISAGFDAHREDPIGSLKLETETFADLTKIVQQVAAQHAEGRIVSVLEGGYNTARLADSVAVHLAELLGPGLKPEA
jgi:acetoin utilization deacetylase AcuC-like enzyme